MKKKFVFRNWIIILILLVLFVWLLAGGHYIGAAVEIIILLALVIAGSWFLTHFVLDSKFPLSMFNLFDYKSEQETKAYLEAYEWFEKEARKMETESEGIRLVGWMIENPEGIDLSAKDDEPKTRLDADGKNHDYAILIHGYGVIRKDGMCPYARGFYNQGFNVFCPKNRAHGDSGGRWIGMGWKERVDIQKWIDEIKKEDPKARFIIFGVSMGGAAALMCAGENMEGVQACIGDCGYTSVADEFRFTMPGMFGLPAFPMLNLANLMARSRVGFDFEQASAKDQLKKAKQPVLIIHGKQDYLVPPWMSTANYEAAACPKQLQYFDNSQHANSVYLNYDAYWKLIHDFLRENT